MPLILVIVAALIIMLYKSYKQPLQPKPTLQLSKLPEGMFPELEQVSCALQFIRSQLNKYFLQWK